MFGTITLISTMFLRTMQNGFASVGTEMRSEFANVRTEIGAVHGRIDHLDRDVNAIYRHLFGIDRG